MRREGRGSRRPGERFTTRRAEVHDKEGGGSQGGQRFAKRRKVEVHDDRRRHDKEEGNYDDAGDYSQSNVTTVSVELGGPAGAFPPIFLC